MLHDRRSERRTNTKIPCSVFINGLDFCGRITNVSENGLSIIINYDENIPKIVVSQAIIVQFIARLNSSLIDTETCVVKNITKEKGRLRIGCYLLSNKYIQIVQQLRAQNYAEFLNKNAPK